MACNAWLTSPLYEPVGSASTNVVSSQHASHAPQLFSRCPHYFPPSLHSTHRSPTPNPAPPRLPGSALVSECSFCELRVCTIILNCSARNSSRGMRPLGQSTPTLAFHTDWLPQTPTGPFVSCLTRITVTALCSRWHYRLMPPYSFLHSKALGCLVYCKCMAPHSFPGLGDSTGMSSYISLRYPHTVVCTSLPFLRSGLHQRAVSIALWSGCALADGVLFVLLCLCWCWFGFCGCVVLCLSGWLGFWWRFSLGCLGLCLFWPVTFWIIARNTRVLHGFELDGRLSLTVVLPLLFLFTSFHSFSLSLGA